MYTCSLPDNFCGVFNYQYLVLVIISLGEIIMLIKELQLCHSSFYSLMNLTGTKATYFRVQTQYGFCDLHSSIMVLYCTSLNIQALIYTLAISFGFCTLQVYTLNSKTFKNVSSLEKFTTFEKGSFVPTWMLTQTEVDLCIYKHAFW